MTRAIQKQIERSRQAKAGAKRIEVVLDAGQLLDLQTIKDAYGYTTSQAVSYAISAGRTLVVASQRPILSQSQEGK
jgi:Ribonuclease G/E